MYRLILRCAVPVLFFSLGHAQTTAIAQTRPDHKAPIIDVHLHAMKLSSYIVSQSDKRWWPQDLKHPSSDAGVMRETLATMKRYNIVRAVTSEDHANVEEWRRADPDRIIPALTCACVDPEEQSSVRQWVREGNLKVLGEVVWQYHGLTPNDPRVEPVWQLVEALDLPLGIHMACNQRDGLRL